MNRRPITPLNRQHGLALVEALVAFLLLSLGVLAATQVQAHLRLAADTARQRSEALRLAQQNIEGLRAFTSAATWAGIVDGQASVDGDTTRYTLSRAVSAHGAAPLKFVSVEVQWADRRGGSQSVALHAAIAGVAPGLSGALTLAPAAPLVPRP